MSEPMLEKSFEEQFAELLDPFKQMLRLVRGKLSSAELEVERLKGEERQILRGLRAIDPTFERNGKPGPKSSSGGGYHVSEERLARLADWFVEERDGIAELFPSGWTGTELHRDYLKAGHEVRDDDVGLSSFQAAVVKLHGRGVIRLARRGKGGSKIYVVV